MNKKISIKIILFVFIIMSFSFISWKSKYVKLILLKKIQNSKIDVNFNVFWILYTPNDESIISINELNNWGIDFDKIGIDFNKNNVILSFNREIKEMKFVRMNRKFPYKTIGGVVKTIMSKNFEPNTIYIYKIPKYSVGEDDKAKRSTFIEK